MNQKVLDVCCGSKMFYFDKKDSRVLFCDNRSILETLCDGRTLEVSPDVISDFTDLPFRDGTFPLVIFDPPHLCSIGGTSWMAKKYGKLPKEWRSLLSKGFEECFRVSSLAVIFKWNETQIPIKEILMTTKEKPVLGQRGGKSNKTHWILFLKGEKV